MQPAGARSVAQMQAGRRGVICHFRHRPGPPPVSRQRKHAPSSRDASSGGGGKRQPVANGPPQQQPGSSGRRPAPAADSHTGPSSWAQRMACIQGLMARVQQRLQGGGSASSSGQLVATAEQHLELLMQLAEAEQRHITGDLPPEQLQHMLDDMQQQLQQERDALIGSEDDSGEANSTSTSSGGSQLGAAERSELLGSNEALKQAVERASANLSSRQQEGVVTPAVAAQKQQQAAGGASGARAEQVATTEASVEQLEGQLQDTQAALQAAEAALQDSEALRMEYDVMCQQSFEASRKLSALQLERDELERQLSDARARAVAAAEELAEHRELQMQYDHQCQDMYRLRMMLQQAQAAGREAAESAAAAAARSKQDTAWLMESHRRELKEANQKNQELIDAAQQLRLRLLELQQQLWGQEQGQPTGAPPGAVGGDAAAPAALEQQQQQQEQRQAELERLRQAGEALAAEKQQLMRSLQEMQREQAVLLVELQQLRGEQARQQQQDEAAAAAAAAAAAVAPAGPSDAEQALVARLEAAEQQRNTLVQQVQELQQRLQAREQAAAAAAAAAVVPADAAAEAAALAQLQDAKAQMVQLRGQLADTRRELASASGRAAAAEAALQQQAADYEARLAQLQVWYGKQTVVLAALRRGAGPPADGSVGFTNTNRFWVRQEQLFEFLKHWVGRESLLQQQPGFLGMQVQPQVGLTPDGGVDVVVSSLWESIPLWEAWSKSDAARQQHMPTGVFQYVPAKGAGFPEDFVPFRDLEDAVSARY